MCVIGLASPTYGNVLQRPDKTEQGRTGPILGTELILRDEVTSLLQAGKFEEAEALVRKFLKTRPAHADGHVCSE